MSTLKEVFGNETFSVVKSCIVTELVNLRKQLSDKLNYLRDREQLNRRLKQSYFNATTELERSRFQSERSIVTGKQIGRAHV